MPYYFLPQDYKVLKEKAEILEKESKKLGKQINITTTESSEGWHDNAPFDAVMSELGMLKERLKEIGELIRKAKIIQPSKNKDKINIGSLVKVVGQDNKEKWYQIGSYRIMAKKEQKGKNSEKNPLVISYAGPVGQKMLNRKCGDKITVKLPNQTNILIIKEIK